MADNIHNNFRLKPLPPSMAHPSFIYQREFVSKNRHHKECRYRIFSARQHICYSALYAIARPSVRPSHGWISVKDVWS